MRESINQVLNLRKQGKTYSAIAAETGRAKSTISWICKKYLSDESARVYETNRLKAQEDNKQPKILAMRVAADAYHARVKATCIGKWLDAMSAIEPTFICYIAGLYDGEGNHSGTEFSISNSDKTLVSRFIHFLSQLKCDYRISLHLHKSHDKETCEKWWNLKIDHIYVADSRDQKRVRTNEVRENYGTLHIRARKSNGMREALRIAVSKLVASDGYDPSTPACKAGMMPFHQPAVN